GRSGQEWLAVLQPPRVEKLVPGAEHRLAATGRRPPSPPRPGRGAPGPRRPGWPRLYRPGRPSTRPGAKRGELPAGRRGIGQPQVDVHLVGEPAEDVQV